MSNLSSAVVAAQGQLSLGAVAVVGAGLSIDARFPLTSGLNVLLWDALDFDTARRAQVAKALGLADAASKQLVGDDPHATSLAWSALRQSSSGRARFQTQFAALDEVRSVSASPAHEALARLIHGGIVELVISLNWDTALERAYERLFGVAIPGGILHKPHGDASDPSALWVFPDQPGLVTDEVRTAANALSAAHARALLIVGYSGSDEVIVDELIKPLDATWRTIRVGPHAVGQNDIAGPAAEVLPALAEPTARQTDDAAWQPITFHGSRSITAAFRGERLTPLDVDACPELTEAGLLHRYLLEDHAVVLNGPTGSGKSISAYQALRKLADAGVEVLRLRDSARPRGPRVWLSDLRYFPRRKVLFIDDAQDITADTVREFTEHADEHTLILIAGIDHVAGGVRTVRLGANAAVARLAQWVRTERDKSFAEAKALDDSIGAYPRDTHFEHRINVAEQQGTPWLFFYILTGGWRRIGRTLLELRDADRADLLLLTIAVAQVAGVDSGVSEEKLREWTTSTGKSESWMDRGLDVLRARRLVSESDGRVRCSHLQTALSIIRWMLHIPDSEYTPIARQAVLPIASANATTSAPDPTPPRAPRKRPDVPESQAREDRVFTERLISRALDSRDTPLRGLAWFVGSTMSSDVRWHLRYAKVLSDDRYRDLCQRALDCGADEDLASAANLLSDLATWADRQKIREIVVAHDARLKTWYSAISPENAWALGDLANSLHHVDADYAAAVSSYADPSHLAQLIPAGGWPHSLSTGRALNRICNIGGTGVRESIQPHIDPALYHQMLRTGDPEFWRVCSLIENIVSMDHRLALALFEDATRLLASQLCADPVNEWGELGTLLIHFGAGPKFLRGGRRPLPEVSAAMRAFIRCLDGKRIADVFAGPIDQWGQRNFNEMFSFLDEFDPATFKAIVKDVDLDRFERSLANDEDTFSSAGMFAALCFAEHRETEIHDILDRLERSWTVLDPYAAACAPDITVRALKRGLTLDLGLDHHHWGFAAYVVARIFEHDQAVAYELIEANQLLMQEGLIAQNHSDPWEGLRQWVLVCDRAAPGFLDRMISSLPVDAVANWDRALKRPRKYGKSRRADIAPLVLRAAALTGHVRDEALQLLKRYPSVAPATPTSQFS